MKASRWRQCDVLDNGLLGNLLSSPAINIDVTLLPRPTTHLHEQGVP